MWIIWIENRLIRIAKPTEPYFVDTLCDLGPS